MARRLSLHEMSFDFYKSYKSILETSLNRSYADLILGKPQEVRIPSPSREAIVISNLECSCISCSSNIHSEYLEDCTYETEDSPLYFYICRDCQ